MASAPYSIAETVPADSDFVRLFPTSERTFRDIVESWLSQISDAATGYPKAMSGTDAARLALSPAPGNGTTFFTTDTYNDWIRVGGNWVVKGIQPGTIAIFAQDVAPLGWTQINDVEVDEAILELTIGGSSGGNYEGSTPFRDATLSQANLPNVNFTVTGTAGADGDHSHTGATGVQSSDHTHTFSENSQAGGDHRHFEFANSVANNDVIITNSVSPAVTSQNTGDDDYIISYDDENAADATLGLTSASGTHTHVISGTTSGMSLSHTHSISASGTHTHSVTGNAASGGSGTAYLSGLKRVRAILCEKD